MHKELGLSAAVSKKITNKLETASHSLITAMRASGAGKTGKVQVPDNALTKKMEALQKAHAECLAMLTPKQKARLREIDVQLSGVHGLTHPWMAKELGLSTTQVARINSVIKEGFAESMRGLERAPANLSEQDRAKRIASLRTQQETAAKKMFTSSVKILTPVQIAKWKAMQGKPFKLNGMVSTAARG